MDGGGFYLFITVGIGYYTSEGHRSPIWYPPGREGGGRVRRPLHCHVSCWSSPWSSSWSPSRVAQRNPSSPTSSTSRRRRSSSSSSSTPPVKGADGSALITSTIPSQDSGIYGTEPEMWFQEISGAEDRVTVGDAFRITSMDRSYEGATVQVTRQGEILATATLPGTFW